jgi:hypothetical protein
MKLPRFEQDLLSGIAYLRGWKIQEPALREGNNLVLYSYERKIPINGSEPKMFVSIIVAIERGEK